jgi:hypothetical protein
MSNLKDKKINKSNEDDRDHRVKFINKLPNKIISIKNKDKEHDERWGENRGIINFPRPYRMIICGPCGVGKTLLCKNIILRAYPAFDRILVCHLDPKSREYDDLSIPEEDKFFNGELPELEFFENKDPKEKWLIVIEEYEFQNEDKNPTLSKLFRYISSHYGVSIILNYQNFTNIAKIARRLANIFVVYKLPDTSATEAIGKKVGLRKGEISNMFEKIAPNYRDSLCFDMTLNSPYPMRLNLFQKITKLS